MSKELSFPKKFFAPLQNFAEQLTSKFLAKSSGEPDWRGKEHASRIVQEFTDR